MNTMTPQLNDLEQISRCTQIESGVAMESFADTVRRIVPIMRTSIASYAETVKDNLASMMRRGNTFDYKAFEQLASLMEKHDHVNTIDLRFYVPEGFHGNVVEYAQLLVRVQAHTNQVVGGVLTPYNVYLSKLLSNKNAQADSRVELAELLDLSNRREVLRQSLEAFFPKGSTKASIKLGEAVSRKQDWRVLGDTLRTLANNFDKTMPGKVSEGINHCSELLEALSDSSSQGGLDAISNQQLRILGDSTLEVAKEVEFFSVVNYQINSLLETMVQNGEFLKKALSK